MLFDEEFEKRNDIFGFMAILFDLYCLFWWVMKDQFDSVENEISEITSSSFFLEKSFGSL